MKRLQIVLIALCTLCASSLTAHPVTDTLPPDPPVKTKTRPRTKGQAIAQIRAQLIDALLDDDLSASAQLSDSLFQMDDEYYASLIWDERWLLYYYLRQYAPLMEEAANADDLWFAIHEYKSGPGPDRLFTTLDSLMLERRLAAYEDIRTAFLSEEERIFAIMLLDFMLRVDENPEERAIKAQNFLKRYPQSRFKNQVERMSPVIYRPGNAAFGIQFGMGHKRWTGAADQTLNPFWGLDFGFFYWRSSVSFSAQFAVGWSKTHRALFRNGFEWPKGSLAVLIAPEIGLGFDIVNTDKFRIYPSILGGFAYLGPQQPSEDAEPNPDYYVNFDFFRFHYGAALQADLKFKNYRRADEYPPPGSYHGLTVSFGFRRMDFGVLNHALQGNMMTVSILYGFFYRSLNKK
ncbi:MAG: hypothetical protein ACK4NS_00400 [Saprospiraceae bacterium]